MFINHWRRTCRKVIVFNRNGNEKRYYLDANGKLINPLKNINFKGDSLKKLKIEIPPHPFATAIISNSLNISPSRDDSLQMDDEKKIKKSFDLKCQPSQSDNKNIDFNELTNDSDSNDYNQTTSSPLMNPNDDQKSNFTLNTNSTNENLHSKKNLGDQDSSIIINSFVNIVFDKNEIDKSDSFIDCEYSD